jgi:hypothetical protein
VLVTRSLHVRLDETSAAALRVLRGDVRSDSAAVRMALREAAARRSTRSALAEEVARLEADPEDRAERARVMADMEALAPDWPE